MSKYTTEVRYICESKSGFTPEQIANKSVDEIIEASWDQIFDFPYNFGSDDWNERIAKYILKYYYTREIGLETVGLWKLKLNTRTNEISGKYEPMIAALDALTVADFSSNYKYTGIDQRQDNLTHRRQDDLTHLRTDNLQSQRTDDLESQRTDDLTQLRTDNLESKRTDDLENQRTDNLTSQRTDALQSQRTDNLTKAKTGESKDKYSDTPQNGLSSVENGNYLTNYRNVETTETEHDTGTQTTADTGTQTTADTGTQTTTNTGTQTTKDTGTQTTKDTGTQTTTNTGTQTTNDTGTQTLKDTGFSTLTDTGFSTHNYTEAGYKGGATLADYVSKIEYERFNILGKIVYEYSDLFMLIW